MWLTERLAPDFKTIADFRKDNGEAIRLVCREFVMLCRKLNLFANAFVAIDGSEFKAVNNRDRNFTRAKMKRRLQQIDESIERYLGHDRTQLANMAQQAKAAMATDEHHWHQAPDGGDRGIESPFLLIKPDQEGENDSLLSLEKIFRPYRAD